MLDAPDGCAMFGDLVNSCRSMHQAVFDKLAPRSGAASSRPGSHAAINAVLTSVLPHQPPHPNHLVSFPMPGILLTLHRNY